jgi:fatty acid desaturase 2 (delta-6 desaturase)
MANKRGYEVENVSQDEDRVGESFKRAKVSEDKSNGKPQTATEVFIEGKLYDCANFKHPGGTVIKFLMGSGDATATFDQFHLRSKKAKKILASLPKRAASADTIAKVTGNQAELAKDFQKLTDDLKAEGFFKPDHTHVVYRLAEIFALFAIGLSLFLDSSSWALKIAGLIIVGIVEGRCGWLMHDGGHGSLTGSPKLDKHLQNFLYGFGCGMSAGWWRSNHNKHHAAPQKLKHDADLDTLPLVCFNAAVSKGIRSPAMRTWLQAQAYLFMPFTCFLVVLGWQLFLHPRYIVRTSKWGEMAMLVARYYVTFTFALSGFSWAGAIAAYLFVQQIAGSYIFTNFALSHTHLDVVQPDQQIHWTQYASDHTVNLSNHWFVNWWMAYLNFQIEHHLFPMMPQFRHPQTSPRVRALFEKHGLRYDVRGYFYCLGQTLSNLHDVGNPDDSLHDITNIKSKEQ